VTWGLHDSVEMEQQGRPAVTLVTEAFESAALARAAALGLPDHPRVTVAHPLASRRGDEVATMAAAAAAAVAAALVKR
jgi:hypothetical protein